MRLRKACFPAGISKPLLYSRNTPKARKRISEAQLMDIHFLAVLVFSKHRCSLALTKRNEKNGHAKSLIPVPIYFLLR